MEDMKTLTVNGVTYAIDLTDEKKAAIVQLVIDTLPDGDEVSY